MSIITNILLNNIAIDTLMSEGVSEFTSDLCNDNIKRKHYPCTYVEFRVYYLKGSGYYSTVTIQLPVRAAIQSGKIA